MFVVELARENLSYDVHSLVKAFYPGEQVKVLTDATDGEEKQNLLQDAKMRILFEKEDRIKVLFLQCTGQTEAAEGIAQTTQDASFGEAEQHTVMRAYSRVIAPDVLGGFKNAFKAFLYESLCDYTGKKLPWGNLTGIRPTKIVQTALSEGVSEAEIRRRMQDVHFVSEEKLNLSVEIAKREIELLGHLSGADGYSLYVGIPFCPTTCLYCSFTSYPIAAMRDKVETYIDCMIKEMRETARIMQGKVLDTVYIGGGTPTTLESEQLDRLITALETYFDMAHVKEFTVEAGRADSITREKLEVLRKHGVSRISVNPQTMNEETLKFIGRRASAAATIEAYHLAREVGFDNINMDIIIGLPGETEKDVARTIEIIEGLKPESLTVHSLAIKRASKLRRFIEENGMSLLQGGDEMMEIAAAGAARMRMHPYYLYRQKNMSGNLENVGFAKEGAYGIYNILIMEEVQTIVALGAGSITKRVYPAAPGDGVCGPSGRMAPGDGVRVPSGRIERCDNVKDVDLYIEKIDEMIERKRKLFAE